MPVSILATSSGAATEVRRVNGSMVCSRSVAFELADVGEASGHGGRRDHRRAHDVGACAAALPSVGIAVGRRRGSLTWRYKLAVRTVAHRTARLAPFEARLGEHAVETFRFRLALDLARSRRDEPRHDRLPAPQHFS